MKRLLMAVIFVTGVLLSAAQKKTTEYTVEYYGFTGANQQKLVAAEGNLVKVRDKYGNVTESYRTGEWKAYYTNGKLEAKGNFKDGKRDGFWVEYDEMNTTRDEGNFRMGLQSGTWRRFVNDKLTMELEFANNLKNGSFVEYYESTGGKMSTGEYRNDDKSGRWQHFTRTGAVETEYSYNEAGQLHGKAMFSEQMFSYQPVTRGEYVNGQRVGIWTTRSNKGTILATVDYTNGIATGYDENGNKISELLFSYGAADFVVFKQTALWYSNGNKRLEGKFRPEPVNVNPENNNPSLANATGVWNNYWEDGTLATVYDLDADSLFAPTVKMVEKYVYPNTNGNYGKGEKVLKELQWFNDKGKLSVNITQAKMLHKSATGILFAAVPAVDPGGFNRMGMWDYYDSSGVLLSRNEYDWVSNKMVGRYESYYRNGKLKSSGAYDENEKQTGTWTYYYETGIKAEERPLEKGKINGVRLNYFENGKLSDRCAFVDSKPVGVKEYFHPNGSLAGTETYRNGTLATIGNQTDVNGNLTFQNGTGSLVRYHQNGRILHTANYVNGQLDGLYTEYTSNGKLKSEVNYLSGKSNGTVRFYFTSGGLMEESIHRNGKQQGPVVFYHPNGKLLGTLIFANGELVRPEDHFDEKGQHILRNGSGVFLGYNTDGKVTVRINYLDYCRNGKAQWFYDNGQLEQELIYKYSEAHKPFGLRWEATESFSRSGKPRDPGTLTKGNGTIINYDADGKKTSREFVNGLPK